MSNNSSGNGQGRAPARNNRSVMDDRTRIQGAARPSGGGGKRPSKKKPVKKGSVFKVMVLNVFKALFVMLCLGLVALSLVAVNVVQYVVESTADDDDLLDLETLKLSQTSFFMAPNPNNPNAIAEGDYIEYQELIGPENRIWVAYDDIPEDMVNAVIATEDREFRDHHGVNFRRTAGAFLNEIFGFEDRSFGASTIEQQLIKNLTGEDDSEGEEGYKRKMREIFRAWGMDNKYSKDMIMEAYLNTFGLSGTIAGVQAAAREYFDKDVSQLALHECAMIAGITQAPGRYNPFTNPENCLTRRNDVLTFMLQEEYITQAQYDEAIALPLGLARTEQSNQDEDSTVFSYFSDTVFEQLVADLMEERDWTRTNAIQYIYTAGLRVETTVDLNVQSALEEMYETGYDEDGYFMNQSKFPNYVANLTITEDITDVDGNVVGTQEVLPQSSAAVMRYDGSLAAVVGGIGPKEESLSLNRAVGTLDIDENGNVEVVGTLRQTGSTMKPVAAYALGIDWGIITYGTPVTDAPLRASSPGGTVDWPRNYSGQGKGNNVTVAGAIAESLNTVAVRVGDVVTAEEMYNYLTETLQITSLVSVEMMQNDPWLSANGLNDVDLAPLVLGSQTYGMSAYELASAYTVFGGEETYGVYNSRHCYTRVTDANGNVIINNTTTSVQAIDPESGYVMNRLLANVLGGGGVDGTATAPGMTPAGDMPAVAKTGTTTDDNDRWFVGLTPYYVTAVWWGYDQEHTLYNRWSPRASTNIPPNVWKDLMETVQADLEYKDFPEMPEGVVVGSYCTQSGMMAGDGCPSNRGYFTSFNTPEPCSGVHADPEGEEGEGEAA